jgi:hypothetical protein
MSGAAVGLAAAALLAFAGLVPGAGPAQATGPIALQPGQITDRPGALGANRAQVQSAIDGLYHNTGIDLHVAYVGDFSGRSPTSWANATAARSGMGVHDALLAVATSARQYAFSTDTGFPVSASSMDSVASVAVEPSLRQSQWAAAAIGATQGPAQAASGRPVSAPTFDSTVAKPAAAPSDSSSSSNGTFWAVLAILLLATVAILGFVTVNRRRLRGPSGAAEPGGPGGPGWGPDSGEPPGGGGPSVQELEAEAARLLVETDDAVKTSEQELGFAVAQFGQDSASQFTTTLDAAKQDLAEAFRLRARLDADPAPAEPERREILRRVIGRCTAANTALDAQSASFEQLRDLQHRTPEVLDALETQLAQAPDRIASAAAALEQASGAYSARALAPVAQNPGQARQLVDYAADAVAEARRRLAADEGGQAALAARSAQEALGQVEQLGLGVGRRIADLEQARSGVAAMLDEVDGELAQGRTLLAGAADPTAVHRLTELDQEAARIKAEVQAGHGDPLDQLGRLQAVDAQLDELLLGLRSDRERRAGAQNMLEQGLLAARSDVAAAEDFITTRRGAIGSRARTLHAEASRRLDKAFGFAQADPAAALEAARQASTSARAALEQASNDLSGFGGLGGGPGGRSAGAGALGGLLGAMLGGLAAQSMSGGMRGGRGMRGMRGPGPVVRRPGGFHGAPGGGAGRRGTGGRF